MKTVTTLLTMVSMPPVCPALAIDDKLTREVPTGRNCALGNTHWAIHIRRSVLIHAMPVDRRGIDRSIRNVDDDSIAFVDLDQWAGELVVNKQHWSIYSIRVVNLVADYPVVISASRRCHKIPFWIENEVARCHWTEVLHRRKYRFLATLGTKGRNEVRYCAGRRSYSD